jgi:hypothetical protein
MGRERNLSKTETFFAPMNLAAAALSHFGPQCVQHNIAIPLELQVYQRRFRDKDLIKKPDQFRCLQASMNVKGLLSNRTPSNVQSRSFLQFVINVYDQYVKDEVAKSLDITHPKRWIKYKTKRQFEDALKRVFSYCRHYTSYNPFHRSRLLAYEASIPSLKHIGEDSSTKLIILLTKPMTSLQPSSSTFNMKVYNDGTELN